MDYNNIKLDYTKQIIELFKAEVFTFFYYCDKNNLIHLSRDGELQDSFIFVELQKITEYLIRLNINYSIDEKGTITIQG